VKTSAQVDHLVVAAATLDQGVAWCQETLGVTPQAGGEHPVMGTHNRLLRIDTPAFPRAYLEIIAINPASPPPGRRRWFDLDEPALREAVAQAPRLIHWIAATSQADAALQALRALGIERGPLRRAERATPRGLLQWQISVRDDGQRLFDGALPTLIQWGEVHAADGLAPSALSLQSLSATHPRPDDLRAAYAAIGLQDVQVQGGPANLSATLMTPRGAVTLESSGL
jgi:hypothetical protein